MGKLEMKKQKKKDALFNTAFELFTTKGTNQTTISDIVNKAGVAKGTFYLYFKDKYDIRNKLVSHKTSELFYQAYRAIIEQEITGFRKQLHFMIDFILDALQKDSSLLVFISCNLSWGVFLKPIWNCSKKMNAPMIILICCCFRSSNLQVPPVTAASFTSSPFHLTNTCHIFINRSTEFLTVIHIKKQNCDFHLSSASLS